MNLIFQRIIISIAIFFTSLFIINSVIKISLILEVQSPRHDDFYQVFYDTGNGFNKRESALKYVRATDKLETISFGLPVRLISHLRIDPGTGKGNIFIKSISLHSVFSEHHWAAADIIAKFKPSSQINRYTKQGNLVAIESLGNNPFLVTPSPLSEAVNTLSLETILCRLILSICTFLLSLWFFFSPASTSFILKLTSFTKRSPYRALSVLLFIAFGLILYMAIVSSYNAHPDEYLHINAGKYYFQHWLPPKVGEPDTADSYAKKYGVSYLNELDIVYFIAAKFSNILDNLHGNRCITLRLFNVFLFLLLAVLSVLCTKNRQFFFVLLLTPQVWYVFSYFNGDAFPLFLSIILAYQLVTPKSLFHKYANSRSWHYLITGGFSTAVLLGLLLISKRNYYIFVLFVLFVLAWNIIKAHGDDRKRIIMKYALVVTIAFSIMAARYTCDLAINSFDKSAKITAYAEANADPKYKPSVATTSASFWGLRLKDKGFSYPDIFSKFDWHKISFKSFFGVYGWMNILASAWYYHWVWILTLSFISFITWCIFTKSDRENRHFAILAAAFIFGVIFISSLHSWINDFQAQGRYLFPLIGMFAVLAHKNKGHLNPLVMSWFIGLFFLMSLYSFVFVALARIPK